MSHPGKVYHLPEFDQEETAVVELLRCLLDNEVGVAVLGDTYEASFMLRAFRATQQRLGYSLPGGTEKMRVIRRISSAFKDIPGGQILGSTSDYTLRLINFDLLSDDEARRSAFRERIFRRLSLDIEIPQTFPKVISILRREGLLEDVPAVEQREEVIADITR